MAKLRREKPRAPASEAVLTPDARAVVDNGQDANPATVGRAGFEDENEPPHLPALSLAVERPGNFCGSTN
jgi:hypothetical protein